MILSKITFCFNASSTVYAIESDLLWAWKFRELLDFQFEVLTKSCKKRLNVRKNLESLLDQPWQGWSIGKSKFVWTLRFILILRVKQVDSTFCICLLYIFEHNCGTNRRRTDFFADFCAIFHHPGDGQNGHLCLNNAVNDSHYLKNNFFISWLFRKNE